MRRRSRLRRLALFLAVFPALFAQTPITVFEHVTVIDATGAPPMPDVSVVVRGGLIEQVGKVAAPEGARVVDKLIV